MTLYEAERRRGLSAGSVMTCRREGSRRDPRRCARLSIFGIIRSRKSRMTHLRRFKEVILH
jgi:hypothetical protein